MILLPCHMTRTNRTDTSMCTSSARCKQGFYNCSDFNAWWNRPSPTASNSTRNDTVLYGSLMNWVIFEINLWYARILRKWKNKYLRISSPTEGHTVSVHAPFKDFQNLIFWFFGRPIDSFGFYRSTVYWAIRPTANQKRPFVPFRQTGKTLDLDHQSVTSIRFIKLVKVPPRVWSIHLSKSWKL